MEKGQAQPGYPRVIIIIRVSNMAASKAADHRAKNCS